MAQLDSLKLAEALRRRLVDYASDLHFVRSREFADKLRKLWSEEHSPGRLVSDIWVEGTFPSKQSEYDLTRAAAEGMFDSALAEIIMKNGALPSGSNLFTHQVESLKTAASPEFGVSRPAILVTAGTGAGKTESFLLPALNELVKQPRRGPGMRFLILYPMNALVNDQVERLEKWLKGQDKIRFFHFTSETPEDKASADKANLPPVESCRYRTRQEARGLETRDGAKTKQRGPVPDIVVTNYSMLEYMLCRPQDACFFGNGLQVVVLDEAHLYTGALAAEIALLLRRLYIRCGLEADNILEIATSATLGVETEDEAREFASRLFSKKGELVRLIQGEQARMLLPAAVQPQTAPQIAEVAAYRIAQPLVIANKDGTVELARNTEHARKLRNELTLIAAARNGQEVDYPAEELLLTLSASPLVHQMQDVLWRKKRLTLAELARDLWNSDNRTAVEATVVMLQLTAAARRTIKDYPLIPHRLHLLTRAADGVSICQNKQCSAAPADKFGPFGAVQTGIQDQCLSCAHACFVAARCSTCGALFFTDPFIPENVSAHIPPETAIYRSRDVAFIEDGGGIEKSELARTNPRPGPELYTVQNCDNCGADRESIVVFAPFASMMVSIVAETVLSELPPLPSSINSILPAAGRRLLAFSDSRQEAAKLGPRLTKQHETQLARAALVEVLGTSELDEETLEYLKSKIEEAQKRLSSNSLSAAMRQQVQVDLENALTSYRTALGGGSIDYWANAFARLPLLKEFVHPKSALSHQALSWNQTLWEDNWNQVKKRADKILAELCARPSVNARTPETLGLVEIGYPGIESVECPARLLSLLPNDTVRDRFKAIWTDYLKCICDTIRVDGAISIGTDDENYQAVEEGLFVGTWMHQSKGYKSVRSFAGSTKKQRRRAFTASVLERLVVDAASAEYLAEHVLKCVFDVLLRLASARNQSVTTEGALPWLERDQRDIGSELGECVRVVFRQLSLGKPLRLFRCTRTNLIFPRSVEGCSYESRPSCSGTLLPVKPDELDQDYRVGRQRREFKDSPVFRIGLWAEEHSAQLAPSETRRLQDLFKAGIRNVLSATTTMELGIDIGGLNAVLMSNVPPGKANYLQRAGRSGRRTDGSAIVVTFARPRPYDREVFNSFGDYLDAGLRKPLVFLERKRLVRRHFNAYLLGRFFNMVTPLDEHVGAMRAYGDMGSFCGVNLPPYWDERRKPIEQPNSVALPEHMEKYPWWNKRAKSLQSNFGNYIKWLGDHADDEVLNEVGRLFANTPFEGELNNWNTLCKQTAELFRGCIEQWSKDYDILLESWREAEVRSQCNAIRWQLRALKELMVIESLSDRQFLPRYGFPIGVHKLRVLDPENTPRSGFGRVEDQYRLERSSILALREYVPGSQLLVGGRLITSHGLLKHWTGQKLNNYIGLRGWYAKCEQQHEYYSIAEQPSRCSICGADNASQPRRLLFPRHGFSGAAWDPPRWSYDIERVGKVQTATITFVDSDDQLRIDNDFGEVNQLRALYREDGELLVYNDGDEQNGFAICLKCGYSDSEPAYKNGKQVYPKDFEKHAALHDKNPFGTCWRPGENPELRNQILAARETTDVLMLDFADCTPLAIDHSAMLTIGYALQRAGSQMLELDSRELGVMLAPCRKSGNSLGVVIYDTAAGGAGHVLELMNIGRPWLERALRVLKANGDPTHNQRCQQACLDCILSFDNQLNVHKLNRLLALRVLEGLMGGGVDPSLNASNLRGDTAPPATIAADATKLSKEERIRRSKRK